MLTDVGRSWLDGPWNSRSRGRDVLQMSLFLLRFNSLEVQLERPWCRSDASATNRPKHVAAKTKKLGWMRSRWHEEKTQRGGLWQQLRRAQVNYQSEKQSYFLNIMTFLAFDTSPLDYFCIPKHGDNFFFFYEVISHKIVFHRCHFDWKSMTAARTIKPRQKTKTKKLTYTHQRFKGQLSFSNTAQNPKCRGPPCAAPGKRRIFKLKCLLWWLKSWSYESHLMWHEIMGESGFQ